VVAALQAVGLVGSYELLMMIIRAAQLPGTGEALRGILERSPDPDPLQAEAVQAFAGELAAGRVPSVRISAPGCMWGSRAQRLRAYLATLNGAQKSVSLEHPAAIPAVPSAA
jgi:hypothetical protein